MLIDHTFLFIGTSVPIFFTSLLEKYFAYIYNDNMKKSVKPTTKEQLIYYMVQHLSLGTYDNKFLTNINEHNKPLTTNQASLLDKIIQRYSKQLAKQELNSNELLNLPWHTQPIPSIPEYTHVHIKVEGDTIEIRSPYKKDYVDALKKCEIPIVWNRDERIWRTTYCEHTLKYIINHSESNYDNVNYCDTIKGIIDNYVQYENCKYWNPTLVYSNDSYYVTSINEPLYNATSDLLKEEINFETIAKLVCYGIDIDLSVDKHLYQTHGETLHTVESIEFARDRYPILDVNNLDNVIAHIKQIGSDMVILAPVSTNRMAIKNKFKDKLVERNIPFVWIDSRILDNPIEINNSYKFPVVVTFGLWKNKQEIAIATKNILIGKTIYLADSQPINLTKTTKEKYENM